MHSYSWARPRSYLCREGGSLPKKAYQVRSTFFAGTDTGYIYSLSRAQLHQNNQHRRLRTNMCLEAWHDSHHSTVTRVMVWFTTRNVHNISSSELLCGGLNWHAGSENESSEVHLRVRTFIRSGTAISSTFSPFTPENWKALPQMTSTTPEWSSSKPMGSWTAAVFS